MAFLIRGTIFSLMKLDRRTSEQLVGIRIWSRQV